MTHRWHDIYRHQKTLAHHLDPRAKMVVGFLFVLAVVLPSQFSTEQLLCYPASLALSYLLVEAHGSILWRKALTLLPFVVLMFLSMALSTLSWERLGIVLWKALMSMGILALVALTTPFPDFLRALNQSRCPKLLILFLAFLYRYADVTYNEVQQVERAWTARYFGRFWLRQWQRLGQIVATLFVRSFERAERIYMAMQARGFSGASPTITLLHFGTWDVIFLGTYGGLIAFLHWGLR